MSGPLPGECRILRLLDDGTPVVQFDDTSLALPIDGVEVPVPLPAGYVQIMIDRLGRPGQRLRCEPDPAGTGTARFSYLAWQDKSGDVWADLAQTLLEEGLVRVAAAPFLQRSSYQRFEQTARNQRLGIWQ